jgi:hypothetical protein
LCLRDLEDETEKDVKDNKIAVAVRIIFGMKGKKEEIHTGGTMVIPTLLELELGVRRRSVGFEWSYVPRGWNPGLRSSEEPGESAVGTAW